MTDKYHETELVEDIKGHGKVKSLPKFIGSIFLIGTGALVVDVAIEPMMGEPAGPLPVLRAVLGIAGFATGFIAINNLKRELSEEQLQDYYNPQLPLE